MKRRELTSKWLPGLAALLLAAALVWAAVDFWALLRASDADVTQSAVEDSETPSPTAERSDYSTLVQAHLFGTPQAQVQAPVQKEIPETRARLTLHGVIVDGPRSGAIVGEQGGRQQFVPLGGETPGGFALKEVHADRVVLERSGNSELLRFPQTATVLRPPAQPADQDQSGEEAPAEEDAGSAEQSGSLVKQVPLAQWQQHFRVLEVYKDGDFQGYRVLPGPQRDFYQQLAIEPGDVVVAVGGEPVEVHDGVETFAQQLATRADAGVRVRRGDQVVELGRGSTARAEQKRDPQARLKGEPEG